MKTHVPNEVSYKAARALAYLMTRKWWKELRDTYYKLKDNHYKESGLSIEDWILTNADINTVACIIPWGHTKTNAITWGKRHREFQKLWMDNFNGNPEESKTGDGPLFKVGDKVRVKERTEDGNDYSGAYTDDMVEYAGKVFTVTDRREYSVSQKGYIPDDGCYYSLEGKGKDKDVNMWAWASSMLEKA